MLIGGPGTTERERSKRSGGATGAIVWTCSAIAGAIARTLGVDASDRHLSTESACEQAHSRPVNPAERSATRCVGLERTVNPRQPT